MTQSLTGRPDPAKKTIKIVSAGGAVIDKEDKVLILRRKVEGTWVLPKGRREEGETLRDTALREVTEETGIANLKIEREIGMVRYVFFWRPKDVNFKKTVHYFLMTLLDGGADINLEPDFSEHKWVDYQDAMKTLTFENDRRIVRGVLNH
jgi:8-oxo-dGTP pyrophosphatase MutT (NUDIX family)